jgi:hypothetical protein
MRTVRLIKNISRFSIGFAGTLSLACMAFSSVHAQELKTPSDQPSNSAANISKVVTKDELITEKQKASELFTVAHAQPAQPADQGAIAQNMGAEKKEADKKEVEKPNRFTLSADFFHRFYREEEIVPSFKSDEFGSLIGGQADYDYIKGDSLYFGASLRYAGGKTTYDGGLQDGAGNLTPATGTTDNRFLNINARLGYTFKVGAEDKLLLTPFVGVGYNKWQRDVSNVVSPIFGPQPGIFFSDYSWTTVDVGLKSEYKLSPNFDIGLNLKVLFPGNGRVSTVPGALGNKAQYEIELPLTYHLTESSVDAFDIRLAPYYRSQDIGRSSGALEFVSLEPNSTTAVYGATLGFVYRFQPIGPGATASATPAVPSKAKDSLRYK